MPTVSYIERRGELETYFDRTAVQAWSRLTSDAPVGRIRATVRAGRDAMRQTLLDWLPSDLRGSRILDAGCGTGMFAVECARRGAHVVAVDISPSLVNLARQRTSEDVGPGRIEFLVGDMLAPAHGRFDHIVAMDSLIHYAPMDAVQAIGSLARRTSGSIIFTFAPRTPALAVMHAIGRMFPRSDRAPSIVPIAEPTLRDLLADEQELAQWTIKRTRRIASAFYKSQAVELVGP
jgi:magnesium-protoporphyrin O-methyltransferase